MAIAIVPPRKPTSRSVVSVRLAGAREHNLKNIHLDLPMARRVVITGVSGSGKSSLVFDTLAAEGLRRLTGLASLQKPGRAREDARRISRIARPDVDRVDNLPAVVCVGQGDLNTGKFTNLASLTNLSGLFTVILLRHGAVHCPECNEPAGGRSLAELAAFVVREFEGKAVRILARAVDVDGTAEFIQKETATLQEAGFTRAFIVFSDGRSNEMRLDEDGPGPAGARRIHAVVDRLVVRHDSHTRILESLERAAGRGRGMFTLECAGALTSHASERACARCEAELQKPGPGFFVKSSDPGRCGHCLGTGLSAGGACEPCDGTGYSKIARSIQFDGRSMSDLLQMDAAQALQFWSQARPAGRDDARVVVADIVYKLSTLCDLGLGAMTLGRPAAGMSSGELRRARCAAALGSRTRGLLYLFDEPTAGCHPSDRDALIARMDCAVKLGNTLFIVEHDLETIATSDHVVELGPGAGRAGGNVVFEGTPDALAGRADTATGPWLSPGSSTLRESLRIAPPAELTKAGWLAVRGARGHNLKNINVQFPAGALSIVTGVSGSGKSSLIFGTLAAAARRTLSGEATTHERLLPCDGIDGLLQFDRRLVVGPRLPAVSARSTPASYLHIAAVLRDLLATTPGARARGLDASNFSANRSGWRKRDGEDLLQAGRCEACAGLGFVTMDVEWSESATMTCEVCQGARFSAATLEVRFQGRSIADWYQLDLETAASALADIPEVQNAVRPALELGLGYIQLGERADHLSGGELQRLQIARELGRLRSAGRALILLDEPSRGLHPGDCARLIDSLRKLAGLGHAVIVVEHSLLFIPGADWIVDLGPGSGRDGGSVQFQGTPAEFLHKGSGATRDALGRMMTARPQEAPAKLQKKGPVTTITNETAAAPRVVVRGAHARNLKIESLDFDSRGLTVVSGPSGAGKSALVEDVLVSEGRHRFQSALATGGRRDLEMMRPRTADQVAGLGLVMHCSELEPDTTTGEATQVLAMLATLFAKFSVPHCRNCNLPLVRREPDVVAAELISQHEGLRAVVASPLIRRVGETAESMLAGLRARGFVRITAGDREMRLANDADLREVAGMLDRGDDALFLIIDRFVIQAQERMRVIEALREAVVAGRGRAEVRLGQPGATTEIIYFDRFGGCPRCHEQLSRPFVMDDFLTENPGPAAMAARFAGVTWPDSTSGGWTARGALEMIQKARTAPGAAASHLLDSMEERLSYILQLTPENLRLNKPGGAVTRAAWIATASGETPVGATLLVDDPSRGLSERESATLASILEKHVSQGRQAITASNDPIWIAAADTEIVLGPGAGPAGGRILYCGPRRQPAGAEAARGARGDIQQKLPVCDHPRFHVIQSHPEELEITPLQAWLATRRDVVLIDGGRSAGASVVELLECYEPLCRLLARTPEAREMGFGPARFLFTSAKGGGRCDMCSGRGVLLCDATLFSVDEVPCPACDGSRFEPRTRGIRLYGKPIHELLQLSLDEAAVLFCDHPELYHKTSRAASLGLGHLQLAGRTPPSLSEAARLRLAVSLTKDPERMGMIVLRVLDGLFGSDLLQWIEILQRAAVAGSEVILVDPRDVVAACSPRRGAGLPVMNTKETGGSGLRPGRTREKRKK